METIFWICVKIMQLMSDMLGITYQQLNVLLFVLIHPAITIVFWFKYRKYKRLFKALILGQDIRQDVSIDQD
jgi:hypothetical protein